MKKVKEDRDALCCKIFCINNSTLQFCYVNIMIIITIILCRTVQCVVIGKTEKNVEMVGSPM